MGINTGQFSHRCRLNGATGIWFYGNMLRRPLTGHACNEKVLRTMEAKGMHLLTVRTRQLRLRPDNEKITENLTLKGGQILTYPTNK